MDYNEMTKEELIELLEQQSPKRVVINTCYGGYGLSKEAYEYMGMEWDGYGYAFESDRGNSKLIKCVEALGLKASGACAALEIVDTHTSNYAIVEFDGSESIETY